MLLLMAQAWIWMNQVRKESECKIFTSSFLAFQIQLNSRDSLCGCDCILCAVTNGTEDDDRRKYYSSIFFFFVRAGAADRLVYYSCTLWGMYIQSLYSNFSISTIAYYNHTYHTRTDWGTWGMMHTDNAIGSAWHRARRSSSRTSCFIFCFSKLNFQ